MTADGIKHGSVPGRWRGWHQQAVTEAALQSTLPVQVCVCVCVCICQLAVTTWCCVLLAGASQLYLVPLLQQQLPWPRMIAWLLLLLSFAVSQHDHNSCELVQLRPAAQAGHSCVLTAEPGGLRVWTLRLPAERRGRQCLCCGRCTLVGWWTAASYPFFCPALAWRVVEVSGSSTGSCGACSGWGRGGVWCPGSH
jgi:hypothetical protein